MRIFLFLFLFASAFAHDFDCILIGSSPFSLLEAISRANQNKKVLVIEADLVCGGAWKTIDICGVKQVDLGCHMIGSNQKLKNFLQTYVGCDFVSLDTPSQPFTKSSTGYYFSRGCKDLITNLLQLAQRAGVHFSIGERANLVKVDTENECVTVTTDVASYDTSKLILTPMSAIAFEGTSAAQKFNTTKHYHLYLLIQDPTPPCFSYRNKTLSGAIRIMNLTHFTDLLGTDRQLVVVQTRTEKDLADPQAFLEGLKSNRLLSESAYLLDHDVFIYEAGKFNMSVIQQLKAEHLVEVLQTGTFQALNNYIQRWEKSLSPYSEIFPIAN